jgi:putative proteasome-type protease
MTYCVGVKLDEGRIFVGDSRTHAEGVRACRRPGLVLLSSGGLAATQAVINVLRERAAAEPPHLWSAGSMFDAGSRRATSTPPH